MNVEEQIAEVFARNQWTWNLKDGKTVPTAWDIEMALDEAARLLYTGKEGDQLEVGRLIIKKKHTGHDVYVYVGEYE